MSLRRDLLIIAVFFLLSCIAQKKVTVASDMTPALYGTYWKLVELNEAAPGLTSREPHLVLSQSDNRVTGNGGCNSLFGTFQIEGSNLTFSNIGSTKMACPGLPVENEFFKSLSQTTRYSFKADTLVLKSDHDAIAKLVPSTRAD